MHLTGEMTKGGPDGKDQVCKGLEYKGEKQSVLLLSMVDRIRNKGVKLQQLRINLNIRKNFLIIRIVKH